MRGWVYIITNKSMPGLIKIGFSTKDPELRAKELANTGVPNCYVVEYDALVDEPRSVEQQLHHSFSQWHEDKEWFRCTVSHAIQEIQRLLHGKCLLENIVNSESLSSHGHDIGGECWYHDCQKTRVISYQNHNYCDEHYQVLIESNTRIYAARAKKETRVEKHEKAKVQRESLKISVKDNAVSVTEIWRNKNR